MAADERPNDGRWVDIQNVLNGQEYNHVLRKGDRLDLEYAEEYLNDDEKEMVAGLQSRDVETRREATEDVLEYVQEMWLDKGSGQDYTKLQGHQDEHPVLPGRRILETLLNLIHDDDFQVRMDAALALRQCSQNDLLEMDPYIAQIHHKLHWPNRPDDDMKIINLLEAVSKIQAPFHYYGRVVDPYLEHPNWKVRYAAVVASECLMQERVDREKLRELTFDENEQVRELAKVAVESKVGGSTWAGFKHSVKGNQGGWRWRLNPKFNGKDGVGKPVKRSRKRTSSSLLKGKGNR